ncbi:MAG: hypothetical protein IIA11_06105 [Proteobacteria bacterium]|nr:hypothetical protein [Pseudomonadota bacterium]
MRHWQPFIKSTVAALVIVGFVNGAGAQSAKTEHTFKLDDADSRPAASLEDVTWLVGSWAGAAFGRTFEEAGSLSLKVKHFSADFTAWEDRQDYVRFRLVKLDKNAVHFSGLSFYRIDDNEIHAFVTMHHEGTVREEKLVYRRSD